MTKRSPFSPDDSVQDWLTSWGFSGNPFATWEAGREIGLNQYFVERSFYEQLRRTVAPTLIFASRGEGKSAMRIMLQSECRPTQPNSPFFAVALTEFAPLVEKYNQAGFCTLNDYLPVILDKTIPNLFLALLELHRIGTIISPRAWCELHYWIKTYTPHYLSAQFFPLLLKNMFPSIPMSQLRSWSEAINFDRYSSTNDQIATIGEMWHLMEKSTAMHPPFLLNSPIAIINALVTFVLDLLTHSYAPCKAFYLLIDGIDEYDVTQNNSETSADILRPLLGNVHFLETPNLAVKFFLPTEQRADLEVVARLDRLTGQVHTLTWEWSTNKNMPSDDLRTLLRRRIQAFNDLGMQTLDELCAPDLRHLLEDYLLKESQNSPRNLLRLGNLLFLEHCREKPQPESRLTYDEWMRAVQRFRNSQTINQTGSKNLLKLDSKTRRVVIGNQELHPPLADLEFRLLNYLYQNPDRICSRQDIMIAVYTEPDDSPHTRQDKLALITDEALGNLVYRLRKKLNQITSTEYLKTFPGQGYLLDLTSTQLAI